MFPSEPHRKDHKILSDEKRSQFIAKVAAAKQAEIERKAALAVKPRTARGQGIKRVKKDNSWNMMAPPNWYGHGDIPGDR